MESLHWKLTRETLRKTNDLKTDIQYKDGTHVQIASRLLRDVEIDATPWEMMDEPNQAALLLHETIYSMIRFQSQYSGIHDSEITRKITGYLFTRAFKHQGASGLNDLIVNSM